MEHMKCGTPECCGECVQLDLFPARETRWPGAVNIAGEQVYELESEKYEKTPFQLELFPSTLQPRVYRKYWDTYYNIPSTEGEPIYEEL